MRKTTLAALSAVLILSGCAKPVLDVPEPSAIYGVRAQAALRNTRLDAPPRTVSWLRGDGLERVINPVRRSAYELCKRQAMTSNGCADVLTSKVTLYTQEHSINAYADRNHDVGVFAGLVKVAGNDAELAAVMAHEFSHIMLGHVEKKTKNALVGMTLATGLAGAFAASTGANPQSFGRSWQNVGLLAGSRAYSPEMEIEADRMAIYILKEAGYPPTAMRDVIIRMHRAKPVRTKGRPSPRRVAFLETHPSNNRRIAHILQAIRDVESGVPLSR